MIRLAALLAPASCTPRAALAGGIIETAAGLVMIAAPAPKPECPPSELACLDVGGGIDRTAGAIFLGLGVLTSALAIVRSVREPAATPAHR